MIDAPILFSAPMIRAHLREIDRPGTGKTQTRRLLTPRNTLFDGGPWTRIHKAQTWDWANAWVDLGPSPAGNPGPYLKLPWLDGPHPDAFKGTVHRIYPCHQPGARLWVREDCQAVEMANRWGAVRYPADGADIPINDSTGAVGHWFELLYYRSQRGLVRRSIHMPRWASRLTDIVTEVRVQRLQDISAADAIAEGIEQWATVGDARTSGGLAWGEIPEGASDDAIFWIADYDSMLSEDADRAVTLDPREGYRALWNSINGDGAWDANPWVIATTFIPFPCNVDQLPEARHADAEPVDA